MGFGEGSLFLLKPPSDRYFYCFLPRLIVVLCGLVLHLYLLFSLTLHLCLLLLLCVCDLIVFFICPPLHSFHPSSLLACPPTSPVCVARKPVHDINEQLRLQTGIGSICMPEELLERDQCESATQ